MTDHAFGCQCRYHIDRPWNRSEHWSVQEVGYLDRIVTVRRVLDSKLALRRNRRKGVAA